MNKSLLQFISDIDSNTVQHNSDSYAADSYAVNIISEIQCAANDIRQNIFEDVINTLLLKYEDIRADNNLTLMLDVQQVLYGCIIFAAKVKVYVSVEFITYCEKRGYFALNVDFLKTKINTYILPNSETAKESKKVNLSEKRKAGRPRKQVALFFNGEKDLMYYDAIFTLLCNSHHLRSESRNDWLYLCVGEKSKVLKSDGKIIWYGSISAFSCLIGLLFNSNWTVAAQNFAGSNNQVINEKNLSKYYSNAITNNSKTYRKIVKLTKTIRQ